MALLRPIQCATPFLHSAKCIGKDNMHAIKPLRMSQLRRLERYQPSVVADGILRVVRRTPCIEAKVDTQHRTQSAAALVAVMSSTASSLLMSCSSPAHASAAESLSKYHTQVLWDLADIDARTAGLLARILQPFLSIGILLMIIRIVLSWYPQIPGDKLPWSVVVKPTEPVLGPTRRLIQPVGGVDISPIIWVALLSFINEILLGPQGILNLLQRKIDIS